MLWQAFLLSSLTVQLVVAQALPKPRTEGGKLLLQALQERATGREYKPDKLPEQVLSDLLWAAFGVNRPDGKRTAPSAHNWQEIDVYAAMAGGLYRYDAKAHKLDKIAEDDIRGLTGTQEFVRQAAVNLVLVADMGRMDKGTDQEKMASAAISAGAIVQNVGLFAASEGLASVVRAYSGKPDLATAMKLKPSQRIVITQTVGYPKLAAVPAGWYPHEGGLLKYRVNIRFGEEPDTMPAGWKFGRVSAVATDSAGEVYVFHRSKNADPLIVFDAKGKYLRSWGREVFSNPHGLRIDKDDNVWVIDNGLHQAMKFTREGRLLMTLGTKGQPGADEKSFYRPTDIAFTRTGDFYISDGYGNSRVVKFSKDGRYLFAWGKKGTGPGEFNTPHAVQTDSRGLVYVSDRENNRIQIFDGDGKFLREWKHLGATQGIFISPRDEMWIITHRTNIENLTYDTLAGRIMRIDLETGQILGAMESPGHWITVSVKGEIFIASLTGNVFRWYPGWLDRGLGVDEGIAPR